MATSFSPKRTGTSAGRMRLADVLELVTDRPLSFRFSAYDGSHTGPDDAPFGLHVRSPRGVAYLATSPGSLGMARAYVAGDLEVIGVHPGDPYPILRELSSLIWRRPDPFTAARVARGLGFSRLVPPTPPSETGAGDPEATSLPPCPPTSRSSTGTSTAASA